MAEWRPINDAPKDGSRQWVKRVHRGQKIAEGWAVWSINSDDSPMRHDDKNGPADTAYADTPRWLNEDRQYSFPAPTHWLPKCKQEEATSEPQEREIVDQLTGALRFILAFYEPGQRYLDTEAWKSAEASGRAAMARGEKYLAHAAKK